MTAGLRFAIISTVLLLGGTARADLIFDAAGDFSPSSNPNGAWQYGWSLTTGSAFVLDTQHAVQFGMDVWRADPASDSFGNPSVFFNGSGSDIAVGSTIWQADRLVLHPGSGGQNAVIRWTAPDSGVLSIDSAFQGRDNTMVGGTTDIHVLHNGVSLLDGTVNGFGPGSGPSFITSLSVLAGDTIDFKVGFGANNNYAGDSTQLDARLTLASIAAPEPSTLALGLTAALIGLAYARRRRTSQMHSGT